MMLGVRELTATRAPTGTYVGGTWETTGDATTFTVYGSVQPLSPRMLQMLPEGLRDRARYRLYTTSELIHGASDRAPDTVSVDDEDLEVQGTDDYIHAHALKHYMYVLVRPERG